MEKFKNYMLHKRAGGLFEGMGEAFGAALPYVVAVPMAAGSAVGYVASKMSSPADSDVKALQARVLDTEVREKVALSKRRLEALKRKIAEKAELETPAESRRRDMFV